MALDSASTELYPRAVEGIYLALEPLRGKTRKVYYLHRATFSVVHLRIGGYSISAVCLVQIYFSESLTDLANSLRVYRFAL